MSSYKAALGDAMTMLGRDEKTIVVGYNCRYGGEAAGTLAGFPQERIEEMPVAENLMASVALGLALDGWIPVLFFERMDFILIALDSIVNHLDKLGKLSDGLHKPAAIIRIVVGNSKTPLFTGPTHCQDFSQALRLMVSFPVVTLRHVSEIAGHYERALRRARLGTSTALIEWKDCYEK